MSRLTTTLALLTLLQLSAGHAALSEPSAAPVTGPRRNPPPTILQTSAGMAIMHQRRAAPKAMPVPALRNSGKVSRLPDGNVEFCAGPGHQ